MVKANKITRQVRQTINLKTVEAVLWLIAIVSVVYAIVGPSGYLDLRHIKRERIELERKILQLEEENRQLQLELDKLSQDPEALERLARQRLGMVKPNEWIVIVPGQEQP